MTIPTAAQIFALLKKAAPRPTSEAPQDACGIYGLYDHTGTFCYIGATASGAETFYTRIHQQHRTGSETGPHYFARAYNTGRMWRQPDDPVTKADGDIAKRLRDEFIGFYCAAVWVPLPDHADIAALQAEVVALAPAEMVSWNRRGTTEYDEPTELVDALVERLALGAYERAALGRQRDRARTTEPSGAALASGLPPLPKGPFRFFALDVETANSDRSSICQVGVACVRHDRQIETWVTLVDPQTGRWRFSDLHGITNAMVQGAPTIDVVIDGLDRLLAGQTVYQHSGFDRSAIRAACAGLGRLEPEWDWLNSVSVARRAWPELSGNGGHGLASLKAYLGLRFEHHDAGEDARAAAEVVLLAERGISGGVDRYDVLDDGDY
ncbi:exonuclease domain-containing protein [Donghicola tyrosinivorans]|uniref:DNA polymerase III epsilon subunit-like protein n=1 Tax=Donghicola tyrosinivorans TaxID=1652492 RepID=A0A2T0WHF5_9RHOB|nr:exonuclease domain-containing protein [Donghicola tyrosinivorans]PRY86140.1 DNA polymerase III epsilon subunit-like protein [Donghicola tyrosinivorans]